MVGGQSHVLVQREATGLRERNPSGVAAGREFVVDGQRRGSGGQPEHGGRLAVQQGFDGVGSDTTDGGGIRQDDDFHYLLAVKRVAPEAISAAAATASSGTTLPASRSSMTTTGTMGLSPAASTDGTS